MHEPPGNVILEAWQHRLPVLSTRNEGALSLVRDGESALLAPLADPAGLAEAMNRTLAPSAAGRDRLAEAAHATVQREHQEDAVWPRIWRCKDSCATDLERRLGAQAPTMGAPSHRHVAPTRRARRRRRRASRDPRTGIRASTGRCTL